MKESIYSIFKQLSMTLGCLCIALTSLMGQQRIFEPIDDKKDILRRLKAVESHPDSVPLHKAYIDAMGVLNPELTLQYDKWIKRFPNSAIVPLVIGDTLSVIEQPQARRYLIMATKRKSSLPAKKLARAYERLGFDAERWGDIKGNLVYLKKAIDIDPSNPNINFYYANNLFKVDYEKWRTQSLYVAKKFAKHQRGVQAMFFLGERAKDVKERVGYYEMMHAQYDPESSWYRVGMDSYMSYLLDVHPDKAVVLAKEMAARPKYAKSHEPYVTYTELVAQGRNELETNPEKALATFNRISTKGVYLKYSKNIPLLKASAWDKCGKTDSAYRLLMSYFMTTPSNKVMDDMNIYGAKLHKDKAQVLADIYDNIYAKAEQGTEFKLKTYLTSGQAALSDFKGKTVLLTYWFPGCGPCRAEFPHFENVLTKYKDRQVAYLGINIDKRQNDYVLPFIKQTQYTFIPLEEQDGREKGNLSNGRSAPVNFILDKNGKILFSRFRVDETNEDELYMMLELATNSTRN